MRPPTAMADEEKVASLDREQVISLRARQATAAIRDRAWGSESRPRACTDVFRAGCPSMTTASPLVRFALAQLPTQRPEAKTNPRASLRHGWASYECCPEHSWPPRSWLAKTGRDEETYRPRCGSPATLGKPATAGQR